MNHRVSLSLLLVIFSASPAHSQDTLRLGYIEFAPYYWTDNDNVARGHFIDLARLVVNDAGYKITTKSYPPKRVSKVVSEGQADLYFGLKTLSDFRSGVLVSKTNLDSIELRAYNVRNLPDLKTKEDLKDKTILILRGYSYGDWGNYIRNPNNNIDYQVADSHTQALRILTRRPVDYLLDYKLPVKLALAEVEVPNLRYNTVFTLEPHIIISKKVPNAESVLNKLEASYKKLFPNGLDELRRTYVP